MSPPDRYHESLILGQYDFKETIIKGSWNDQYLFIELMITREYLLAKPTRVITLGADHAECVHRGVVNAQPVALPLVQEWRYHRRRHATTFGTDLHRLPLSVLAAHDLDVLLPHLGSVVIETVTDCGAGLVLHGRLRGEGAECPRCGQASVRAHSRYQRRLADAPIAGRPVQLRLQVRRFFCDNTVCPTRTFAEQPARWRRHGLGTRRCSGRR